MESFVPLILLPVLTLLGMAFLLSRTANAIVRPLRTLLTLLIAVECLMAIVLAVAYVASQGAPASLSLFSSSQDSSFGLSVYYDGATSLMLVLVSFVGLIVSRFSIRYLDGEAMQGRYFRWLGFTVGAVSLMVVAGNLLLFFAAWVMTSFGLHQLLLHYRFREAAHRAAWTKFTISRLGDAFLVVAIILTFNTFGTLEMSVLFEKAMDLAEESQRTAGHVAIAWLLVLGAVTKSAQFPFHTWLPDTMETPTPVSALMHAGIVNAGGYLIIRMSPLVAMAPAALMTLAMIGAFTACFAGLVMMTQSNVKRALAYSTIAQMGFMMLQCGLGAFSAAMLHIIAHSLYKAHAFLSSGSVVSQARATVAVKSTTPTHRMGIVSLVAAATATAVAYFTVATFAGLDVSAKPGGLLLAFILCLALTTWGWRMFALGQAKEGLVGVAGLTMLCVTYIGSYLVVQYVVERSPMVAQISYSVPLAPVAFALSFLVLFALHVALICRLRPSWLQPLRVHALNGFYVDTLYQRLFAKLA